MLHFIRSERDGAFCLQRSSPEADHELVHPIQSANGCISQQNVVSLPFLF